MAIPKVTPRAILLVGKEHCIMKELIAGGTITPGMLLSINSAGKYVAHATAKGTSSRIFADMYDLNGKGIDDNYVANDWCQAWVTQPGCEVNALVAASAAAIAIGDLVESAGNGTVRKLTAEAQSGTTPFAFTSEGKAVGVALQAVDNSGGGTSVRLQIMTL